MLLPVFIYIATPAVGLLLYLLLLFRGVEAPLRAELGFPLFVVFAHYGVVLELVLTLLLWKWSGMASLGFLYLLSLGMVCMAVQAVRAYQRRSAHPWYRLLFRAAVLYFPVFALGMMVAWCIA